MRVRDEARRQLTQKRPSHLVNSQSRLRSRRMSLSSHSDVKHQHRIMWIHKKFHHSSLQRRHCSSRRAGTKSIRGFTTALPKKPYYVLLFQSLSQQFTAVGRKCGASIHIDWLLQLEKSRTALSRSRGITHTLYVSASLECTESADYRATQCCSKVAAERCMKLMEVFRSDRVVN